MTILYTSLSGIPLCCYNIQIVFFFFLLSDVIMKKILDAMTSCTVYMGTGTDNVLISILMLRLNFLSKF